MGVVFVALFFGRAWCTVCPLGWLNGFFARLGLKLELPRWLQGFVPVTLTLVALQLAVYFLAIHRYPDYTARLLGLMLLLAVLAGLVFRRRAFCSLLCPAGAVFGLYARVAPFQLRVVDPDLCAGCRSQSCISGGEVWKRFTLGRAVLYWRGERTDCPAGLVPAELADSAACSLCLHCVHNCENRNILSSSAAVPGSTTWTRVGWGRPKPSSSWCCWGC
jgi:polyferredoxin